MTEHKYTDEEVIKALECCANTLECKNCPLIDEDNCTYRNINYVLDFINRQRAELKALKMDNDQLQSDITNATMNLESVQHELDKARAEIERLTVEYAGFRGAANSLKMHYENARAEAFKEFAERLKEELRLSTGNNGGFVPSMIDNLVKEMTEGKQ